MQRIIYINLFNFYFFIFFFAGNAESQGALNSDIRRSGSDIPRSFSRKILQLMPDALCGFCCSLRGVRLRNICVMKFCINPKTCDFGVLTRQLTRSWAHSNSTSDFTNDTKSSACFAVSTKLRELSPRVHKLIYFSGWYAISNLNDTQTTSV